MLGPSLIGEIYICIHVDTHIYSNDTKEYLVKLLNV